MASTTNPKKFVADIHQMAKITQARRKAIVAQGALTAKEILIAESAARGVKPTSKIAGGKWGVRYDIKGAQNPTAIVRVIGPFHLVDSPTRAHKIYRKVGRAKGKGSGRINKQAKLDQVFGGVGAYKGGALKFPDGNFRHVVEHPGTKGKGIFKAAKAKAHVAVPRVMGKSVVSGWGEALRG
jgi:hypothetical protein